MKTLVIMEWDNFKDEDKLKKYFDYIGTYPFRARREALEVKRVYSGGWSDGTGHMVLIEEYESMEEFSRLWSDEEHQRKLIRLGRLVKNLSIRILWNTRADWEPLPN